MIPLTSLVLNYVVIVLLEYIIGDTRSESLIKLHLKSQFLLLNIFITIRVDIQLS